MRSTSGGVGAVGWAGVRALAWGTVRLERHNGVRRTRTLRSDSRVEMAVRSGRGSVANRGTFVRVGTFERRGLARF